MGNFCRGATYTTAKMHRNGLILFYKNKPRWKVRIDPKSNLCIVSLISDINPQFERKTAYSPTTQTYLQAVYHVLDSNTEYVKLRFGFYTSDDTPEYLNSHQGYPLTIYVESPDRSISAFFKSAVINPPSESLYEKHENKLRF